MSPGAMSPAAPQQPRRLPVLTTTATKKYRACPRLYSLEIEQGYRAVHVDQNRAFGTLQHRGLEVLWLSLQAGAVDSDAVLAAIESGSADAFAQARACALIAAYIAKYSAADLERYDVLGVEVEYETQLVNPATGAESRTWRVGGKLDGIVRERDTGDVLVVEHKTSSEDISPGADYWTRLTLDSQVSNYLAGARSLGSALGFDADRVVGVLYDVIAKPTRIPLKATPVGARKYTKPTKTDPEPRLYANQRDRDETPAEYFARVKEVIDAKSDDYLARTRIVRLDAEMREAAQDMWQTAGLIRDARRLGLWPRNSDACARYGRTCEFVDVCLGNASLEDPTMFRRAERPNEELAARTHAA